MRISIAVQNAREDFLTLDVAPDTTVALLKSSIALDADIPDARQRIFFNERLLADDAQTLSAAGLNDGDMVSVREARPPPATSRGAQRAPNPNTRPGDTSGGEGSGSGAGSHDGEAEALRQEALRNPEVRAGLRHHRPELAAAADDPAAFARAFAALRRAHGDVEAARRARLAALEADDAAEDPDKQREIEELIREKEVEANLQHALEWLPESFGRVYMLYIPVEVNGHPIKAFVDSGAQATIISPACAERCGIMRLLDKRYAGVARGVGTARILGRVHAAQMRLGARFLGFSATVMEGKDVDLLLGLDMLKGFRACIDLAQGVLRIGDDEVPFLGEADIPKPNDAAEAAEAAAAVPGPAGTRVDGRTGAVVAPGAGGSATMEPAAAAAAAATARAGAPASQPAPSSSNPSAAAAPARPPGTAARPQFPRQSIEQLLAMGFAEAEAVQALTVAGGNVDLAASMLFGG